MKRSALETFKFGQNKKAKQTYFPALTVKQTGMTPMVDAASAKRRQGSTSSRKRTAQT
jgi:hypothetical protein